MIVYYVATWMDGLSSFTEFHTGDSRRRTASKQQGCEDGMVEGRGARVILILGAKKARLFPQLRRQAHVAFQAECWFCDCVGGGEPLDSGWRSHHYVYSSYSRMEVWCSIGGITYEQ